MLCSQAGMHSIAKLLLTLVLVGSVSALAPVLDAAAGWRQGRATFYGGSQQYLRNFPDRYSSKFLGRPRGVAQHGIFCPRQVDIADVRSVWQ